MSDEKFDPVYVGAGDRPARYQQQKKPVPGGREVSGARLYCQAWRKYAEPLASATGWRVHSFGDGYVRLVSSDYKHIQDITLAFIEAIWPLVKGYPWTSSEQFSSEESATPVTSTGSRPHSSGRSTRTSASKMDSSPAETSESPSATSSNSVLSMPLPLKPPSRSKLTEK